MARRFQMDNRARSLLLGLPLLTVALLFVSGCEEDQRAVPPGAVRELATAAAEDDGDDADIGDGFSGLISGEFTRETLPAAERVFFTYGGDLWQIPMEGAPRSVTEDLPIVGYSGNATGDRLAILTFDQSGDDGRERTKLSILLPDSEVIFELSDIADSDGIDDLSPIEAVALNPAGDALAMTHQNGAMSLVTLDGDIQQLMQASIEHRPGRLSWSADGQFIAFLDPWMPDEPSSLYVMLPERDIRQALAHPGADGHGIIRADWIPGTSYIVVSKASGSTISHGGDLFLIDAETGYQELLMSSGEIAPVAGIVDFAPSPDGIWLAVSGFVPGPDYPEFSGLWAINLQSGLRMQASVGSDQTVTDMWWLGEKLLIRAIDQPRTSLPGTYTGREEFQLLEYDPESGRLTERYPGRDDDDDTDSEDDENDDGS